MTSLPPGDLLPEPASRLLQQPQCSDAVALRSVCKVDDLDLVDVCHTGTTASTENLCVGKKSQPMWQTHMNCTYAWRATHCMLSCAETDCRSLPGDHYAQLSTSTESRPCQPAIVMLLIPWQAHTCSARRSMSSSHLPVHWPRLVGGLPAAVACRRPGSQWPS